MLQIQVVRQLNKREDGILSLVFPAKNKNPSIDKQRHPNDLGIYLLFSTPFNNDTGETIASKPHNKKYKSFELKTELLDLH